MENKAIERNLKSGVSRLEYKNWWLTDKDDLHNHLITATNRIEDNSQRGFYNARNQMLYADVSGLNVHTSNRVFTAIPTYNNQIRYNVIRSNVDTVVSKMGKNKPKIQFLTDGGNYKSQQKARNLTTYIKGCFIDSGMYKYGAEALREGCISGTGCLKFIPNENTRRIDVERPHINEILVDEADGMYGKPKCMYQVRYINRWVLQDLYPEHTAAIEDATAADIISNQGMGELIKVTEGWHLPTTIGKDPDGKHVIVMEGATLLSESWDKDYFPFVFFRWSDPVAGFYGAGIADELADLQQEINRTFKSITRSLALIAKPTWWVPSNASVSKDQITDIIGSVLTYQGTVKPFVDTPKALNAESYNHFYWLIEASYKKTGVSQMSATGQKTPGINAAVAIRTMQDIESERFLAVSVQYETMYLDAAKIIIDMSRDLDAKLKDTGGLQVKVKDDNNMKVIKWRDVNLDDDRFIMQLWPVNLLPDKPEGKLGMVSELMESGLINPVQGQRLLDYPDLQAHNNVEFASVSMIDKILNNILYEGKYQAPEPYFDLQYAVQQAQKFYNMGRFENAPERNTSQLLRFIDEVERLVAILSPEPPPEAEVVQEELPPAPEEQQPLPAA